MVNITIDGRKLQVKPGITVIQAIDEAKMDLPRYCYHPGLSIAGNCRICQVEIENMPRPVIACNTRVADGMVVHTATEKAKKAQQDVLEFLLINHPLDCPVCDQAGECKLQDFYMDYGLYEPHFDENKVKKTKKAFSIGPTILLDQERCILCSRCVRFGDEITKTNDFGIFNRGDRAELDIYPGRELTNKYSGNVADICPVGALTDKDFRFKMRVWYLGSGESVCNGCSRGCNIDIHYEKTRPYKSGKGRVMRLKPRENPDVNQWWMCDEGRYGYKPIDEKRLTELSVHEDGFPVRDWDAVTVKLSQIFRDGGNHSKYWAVLASPRYTNEELYLMRVLFKDHLGWRMAFRAPGEEGYEDDFLIKKDKNPNTAGAEEILGLKQGSDAIETVIQDAKSGRLKGLIVFDRDLAKTFDTETLQAVRQNVQTIIFEGSNENTTSQLADFVLPSASFAEKGGTFTNFEGRVQRIHPVLEPVGVSRPTWRILRDLARAMGMKMKYERPEDIFHDLARDHVAYLGMTYEAIASRGADWKLKGGIDG